jgi:F-type H+-transporting ATPase subunit epsilon
VSQFKLEIVTPERVFYSDEVDAVSMTTLTGRIQILAHHISYATGIVPSSIKIRQKDTVKFAAVGGGFVEVTKNKVVILADSAEWPEEIDKNRAEEALQRAKERLNIKSNKSDIDKKRAQIALMRALSRIKVSDIKK